MIFALMMSTAFFVSFFFVHGPIAPVILLTTCVVAGMVESRQKPSPLLLGGEAGQMVASGFAMAAGVLGLITYTIAQFLLGIPVWETFVATFWTPPENVVVP